MDIVPNTNPKPFSRITVCLDMDGCPNRCRHCWLGHGPNGRMSEDKLRFTAAQFRPFTDCLVVDDWYREPDLSPDYRERWRLCQALSDLPRTHFELVSVWRLVRDEPYVEWLSSLGLRAAQLTLFGGEETTDLYTGRRHAYREILEAIDLLIEHRIVPRIQVFVNRENIGELPMIAALIEDKRLEARCAAFGGEFSCFVHQGSCDGENEKLYPVRVTPAELDRVPEPLAGYTLRHFHKEDLMDVFGRAERELYRELLTDRSTESYVDDSPVFFVDAAFNVYPNRTCPAPFWRLGNLKADGAGTILENYVQNKSLAQSVRASLPVCELAKAQGDPESLRLFSKGDYIDFLLNRYCRERS